MKRGFFFKLTSALLVYAHLFWTTIVLAETPRPAGVVTALSGEALLLRATAPDQPQALKFRDDVFFQDRIRTKAHSIVRVLLGGKAVVTVRALSDLTISEEPQQPAVVNLVNGKIALDVARSRMKPGEAIEVHTPNAIAAVRGTMIIVEVVPAAEQAVPGNAAAEPDYQPRRAAFTGAAVPAQTPTVITNFHVLQGSIDVSALGKPGTPPVSLTAGLSLSVTGATMGQPRPSPPAQQLTKDLKTAPPHAGTPEETKKSVSQKQQAVALALAEVLAPKPEAKEKAKDEPKEKEKEKAKEQPKEVAKADSSSSSAEQKQSEGTTSTTSAPIPTTTVDTALVAASSGGALPTTTTTTFTTTTTTTTQTTTQNVVIATTGTTTIQTQSTGPGPLVIPPDQTINTNQTFTTATQTSGILDGSGTVTTTGLYSWSGGIQQGTGTTQADGGLAISGNTTLDHRTLVNGGTTTWTAGTLTVQGGALITNPAAKLWNVQGDLTLAVGAGSGTFNNAGEFRKSSGPGTATINPSFTNSGTVDVQSGTLFFTDTVTNNGALKAESGATLTVSGSLSNFSGGTLTGGTYNVLGTMQLPGNIVTNAAIIVLDGAGSQLLNSSSTDALAGFTTNAAGGSFTIQNGRNFTTAGAFSNAGSMTIGSGSTFTVGGGGSYTQTAGSTTATGALTVAGPASLLGGTMTVNSPLINTSSGSLTPGGNLLTVKGTLTSNGVAPLVQLNSTTITAAGFGSVTTFSEVPPGNAVPPGPSINGLNFNGITYGFTVGGTSSTDATFGIGPVGGPGATKFLSAQSLEGNPTGTLTLNFSNAPTHLQFGLARNTFSSLTPGGHIVVKAADNSVLGTFDLNTSPLPSISEGLFTYTGSPAASAVVTFPSSSSAVRFALGDLAIFKGALLSLEGSGATATLAGPLLQATNLSLTNSNPPPLLSLNGGARLTAAGSLLDLSNSTLNLSVLALLTGGSSLTNTVGPVVRITGGALTADALAISDSTGNSFHLTGSLLDLSNTTVTLKLMGETGTDTFTLFLASGEPAIRMANSNLSLTSGRALVNFGVDSGSPITQGGVALIATNTSGTTKTISLAGPLLRMSGVNLTDTNAQVQISNMTVAQSGVGFGMPDLILAANLPVTVAGPLLSSTASVITVGDVLLAVSPGATLSASTGSPLISINGGSLTTPTGKDLIRVGFFFGPAASVSLAAGLLKLQNITAGNFNIGSGTLVHLTGGSSLTTAGPILDMTNSILALSGPVISLEGGSTLTTTAGPALRLSGGSLTADSLVKTDGTGSIANVGTITTSGTTVTGSGTSFLTTYKVGDAIAVRQFGGFTDDRRIVSITDATHLTINSAFSSDVATPSAYFGPGNRLILTGTVLDLNNATVTIRRPGDQVNDNTDTTRFTLAANEPWIRLANHSTLTSTKGHFDLCLGCAGANGEHQNPFPGLVLVATDSTLTFGGDNRLSFEGGVASSTTSTQSLIQLTNSTLNSYGDLISVAFGAQATVAGPLLSATNSIITTSDPNLNTVTATLSTGTAPAGVAVTADSTRAYVANNGSNTVSVINIATNAVIATVSGGTNPTGVAITPDSAQAYVTNSGSNTVSVINTATNAVTATVSVGTNPGRLAISPDGTRVYVLNRNTNNVSVINTATNSVTNTVAVGTTPNFVAFTPDGSQAYVTNAGSGTVSAINTTTLAVTSIPVGANPQRIAITPCFGSCGFAYVANQGSNNVSVIDTSSNTVTATIPVGTSPFFISITPDGSQAYVTNQGSNNVSVINTLNGFFLNKVISTIPVGTNPTTVFITPDGSRAYVVNAGSNTISVINTGRVSVGSIINPPTLIATIAVGTSPRNLAITPDGTLAYVTNNGSNNVSVLDTNGGGGLINIQPGTAFHSNGTAPLVQMTGGSLTTAPYHDVITIGAEAGTAASMTLAGPLLVATNSTITTSGNAKVLSVNSSSLTTNGAGVGALLQFTGSTVSTGNQLVFISAVGTVVNLDRPLLSATNTAFTTGTSGANGPFIRIVDNVSFTASTTSPLISLNGGSVTTPASGAFFRLGQNSGFSSTVTLAGPLLSLQNITSGNLNIGAGILVRVNGGSSLTAAGPVLDMTNTVLSLSGALGRLEGGSTNTNTSGPSLRINSGSLTADALVSSDGATNHINQTGGLLDLTNTSVTLRTIRDAPTVNTDTVSITLASGDAAIRMTNSNLTLTGAGQGLVFLGGLNVAPSSQAGVALVATNTSGTTKTISTAGPLLTLVNGVTLTNPNAQIQLTNMTVTAGGQSGAVQVFGPPVTMAGPLLTSTNSTISTANNNINTVTATVTVGASPFGVAVSPDGTKAYVVNEGSNTVSVINTATNTVTATVTVGALPFGVAVSPDGTKAYVTNANSNTVSVINTATNTVTATVTVGTTPQSGVKVSPDGTKVYVANAGANTVSVINTATNTVTATVTVGTLPNALAVSPDGTTVYVSNQSSNTVSVINTATNTVTATVNAGTVPFGVAVSPDGTKVYVPNANSNTVSVINTATNTVTATVNVGTAPNAVAVSPDGTKVYVANSQSNTVSVINTATNTVSATVNVGTEPAGVSISPDGTTVYVANHTSNTVSVLDINPGGSFFSVTAGSSLVYTGTAPLVQTTSGTLNVAKAIFDLQGSATATQAVEGNALTLGTDRPLRGSGVCPSCPVQGELLEASGATITTQQAVKLDTALLEATAPLINLLNGSTMTSNSNLVKLVQNAKMNVNVPSDALIKLNASTLTVNNGSLFNVAGGSYLNVTGSLFSLTSSSTLNITSGFLANISGGSVFTLTGGSLGTFGATGTNTLNLTNNTALCSGCSITTTIPNLTGIPVLLANGASASNVTVNTGFTPFAGLSASNKVNVAGASGAVLAVNGATSKVKLGF